MGVFDIDALGGLVPASVVVEAASCANGADDCVSGNRCAIGLRDEEIQGVAVIATAQDVETQSMGMPMDGAIILQIEFSVDVPHSGPAHVGALDLFALGVIADEAFAGVALRVWG